MAHEFRHFLLAGASIDEALGRGVAQIRRRDITPDEFAGQYLDGPAQLPGTFDIK